MCPGRAQRDTDLGPARDRHVNARKSGKPDLRGPRGDTTRRFNVHRFCRVTPGSRIFAPASPSLVRDTRVGRAKSRRAQRTVGRGRIHDVKQRAFLRSRGALLRPGLWSSSHSLSRPPASPRGLWRRRPLRQQQFRPPDEGWMERRQPHSQLRSRLRRATPHPGATGNNSRRSTVAVFGCGPTKPAPGSGTGACSDVPRQAL